MSAQSDSEFQVGRKYRVRSSFSAMRDNFREGEILRYTGSAYSRYDGITGYFFVDQNEGARAWDVRDDDSVAAWPQFFEAL